MRDGVKLARRKIPAVALVTEEFTEQGNFVARSVGMPDVPRLELPHPLAREAEGLADLLEGVLLVAPQPVAQPQDQLLTVRQTADQMADADAHAVF